MSDTRQSRSIGSRWAKPIVCLAAGALAAALLVTAVAAFAGAAPSSASEPAAALAASATTTPSVAAYRGLGTWVDIWDKAVFDAPEASVRAMASRGVRTIYVETSNSTRSYDIHRPTQMRRLIRAAHARKIKVVAWYLPTLTSPHRDYVRCQKAIAFRTADGQRFDSFALDIESSVVKPASERNRRLMRLSRHLRTGAGPGYPLGAIIPSPVGMRNNSRYWPGFPYRGLASIYDVFLPMSYYTYHTDGPHGVRVDTLANVTILRAQPGCAEKPIHLVGGLAGGSIVREVRAFVAVSQETTCIGAGLYDWPTTKSAHWAELKAVRY